MTRVYNFSPGPAALPLAVIEKIQAELLDWQGTGVSILELGHRTDAFMAQAMAIVDKLRVLLNVPSQYQILFLPGAARMQFAAIPMNLLNDHTNVDYIDSGFWSGIAINEAKKYAEVNIAASGKELNYLSIPPEKEWKISKNPAYLHYTANETLLGVEFQHIPNVPAEIPLAIDMTSNFLSYPLDVSRFGLIYAGAQKNAGVAGLSIVIVREDLIQNPQSITPLVYEYRQQAKNHSLLVTPPVFCWYVAGLIFDWISEKGGLSALGAINARKAAKLYAVIDQYPDFYRSEVDKTYRSRMNVCFTLRDKTLEQKFLTEAEQLHLCYLRGHSVTGGIRASIYNFIEEKAIDQLVAFMHDFIKRAG